MGVEEKHVSATLSSRNCQIMRNGRLHKLYASVCNARRGYLSIATGRKAAAAVAAASALFSLRTVYPRLLLCDRKLGLTKHMPLRRLCVDVAPSGR